MLLVFLILIIVTICVTIVCTYFLLNAEDYRWQWTSFLAAGAATSINILFDHSPRIFQLSALHHKHSRRLT